MASGKAKRQRDDVEGEDLPATKRHAKADGPLQGLQQIPQFGAFYPPAQKDSSNPQGKGRKRQMCANGKRTVLPKLPCPLPGKAVAASWEAPELEDSRETIGSTTLGFSAPTSLTLQQTEPPGLAYTALPDRPNPAAAESTKDPQLLPVFPQSKHANGQAIAQNADTQKQQAPPQGAKAFSMPGASDAAAYASIQPQATPQQATPGHQLTLGNPAALSSSQHSQIPAPGAATNVSRADAGGGLGVAAPSSTMPFQPAQPFAVPGQQSGLPFGQLIQQQGGDMVSGEGPIQPQRAVRRVKRGIRR